MRGKQPKVVVNIAKNRLYITISGHLSKENINKLYTEVRFCVADLRPGFSVVTDLSDCTIADLSGIPTFRKITNYLVINKVGRVARIIGKKKVFLRQLLNFNAKVNGYKTDYFNSLTEAETALSHSERRNDLRFVLNEQFVDFTTGNIDGNGFIRDISNSGCAIETTDKLPGLQDKLLISTTFHNNKDLLRVMEIKAVVIWVEHTSFGVQFEDMNDEQQEQLWQRLVFESKAESA